MSSDSESSRENLSERSRRRVAEKELLNLRKQMQLAKREMLKCKEYADKVMYDQLDATQQTASERYELGIQDVRSAMSERGGDTDRSDVSNGSLSSRSFASLSLDTSQELPRCRDLSITRSRHR